MKFANCTAQSGRYVGFESYSAPLRLFFIAFLFSAFGTAVFADTLNSALIQAYRNNPQLNSQRAAVRATDEQVPQALSGYRPRINATYNGTQQYLDITSRSNNPAAPINNDKGWVSVHSYGTTVTQNVFNGFQTASRTRQAEHIVSAARETLRLAEQTILLNAVSAYMNLIRDTAVLDLQRSNVTVLEEQLTQTRDRYKFREVTLTDVAQSEARLEQGRGQLLTAKSNYISSRANYTQVIGLAPGRLSPASPVDRLSPSNLNKGIAQARARHPSVTTAMFNVDAALFQVKIAESALYPSINIIGNAQKTINSTTSLFVTGTLSASIAGQVSVPIYQGGGEYATIRQAKETLQQRRIDLDTARDQVKQTMEQTWAQLDAAKAQIVASIAQVKAAEVALNGVREEARLGQRTVLDVLNAQQELVSARVTLVTAQRDRVIASYSLLAASGALSAQILGLQTNLYDARIHYHQVRDSWAGVRTPDGN